MFYIVFVKLFYKVEYLLYNICSNKKTMESFLSNGALGAQTLTI